MSLESIFTPPGTHNRENQDTRNGALATIGSDIATAAAPGVKQQIAFGNSLEPAREGAIRRALSFATPGMQAGLAEKSVGTINQGLADQTTNLGNQFRSAGLSAGALAGAIGDAGNSATQQINSARNNVFDPVTQARLAEATAGIASQGQQVNTQGLNAGAGLVYGQPQSYVGQGFGSIAGEALGGWAGGGFKTK